MPFKKKLSSIECVSPTKLTTASARQIIVNNEFYFTVSFFDSRSIANGGKSSRRFSFWSRQKSKSQVRETSIMQRHFYHFSPQKAKPNFHCKNGFSNRFPLPVPLSCQPHICFPSRSTRSVSIGGHRISKTSNHTLAPRRIENYLVE